MRNLRLIIIFCFAAMLGCSPEQEVSPIKPPTEYAMVTITPDEVYTNVREGDELIYTITVNKMLDHVVEFTSVLDQSSIADDDDIEVEGGKLQAYSLSTNIKIIIHSDGLPETLEQLNFTISAEEDFYWNWQLNPGSDVEMVDVFIKDYDYSLDWSQSSYEGDDMCEWGIDLDMYLGNADFSVYNLDGATGACPLEQGALTSLPDDTYDIYVDFWDSDLPSGADIEIPYVASFSNNNGNIYTISGAFNSENVGESRIIGQLVIANGVYTLYDDQGTLIGTM